MKRHLFRFKNDFIGKLGDNNWNWNAGLSLQSFKVKDVDVDKFNKGKDPDDPKYLPDVPYSFHIIKVQGSSRLRRLTAD